MRFSREKFRGVLLKHLASYHLNIIWAFRSSLIKAAFKISLPTDNSSLRYSVSKFIEIVEFVARGNFVRA